MFMPSPLSQLHLALLFGIFVLSPTFYSQAQEKKVTPQDKTAATLLRVTTLSQKVYVGQVIENGKSTVRFLDLVSNEPVEIEKSDVKEVLNPLPFDDAAKSIGLPRLLSWKIGLLAKRMNNTGKVAKLTAQVVYVTLGTSSGARVGTLFSVFRNEGEIKDPVTGAVLGIERPTISTLEVTEVEENFSKAKITSNLEIPIQVGDEVESKDGLVIAVCPLRNEDGELTNVGSTMSEEITTSLVQASIKVVERSVLDTVLPELMVQNTLLFDPKSAQKLGELTGANYVVTGKIVPSRNTGTAFVRLVDVQSGEVALAVSTPVNFKNASVVNDPPAKSSTAGRSGGGSRSSTGKSALPNKSALPKREPREPPGTFAQGRIPSFMTTTSRTSQSPRKGLLISGEGTISTKDANFLDRNFTFEVVVDTSVGVTVTNIGMGQKDRIMIRLHSLAQGNRDGEVRLNDELIGHITSPGSNRVTIAKSGHTVTFQIDVGNDGPTDDDLETIIHDIRSYAPTFHSKNVPLFLSGGGEFFSVSLK